MNQLNSERLQVQLFVIYKRLFFLQDTLDNLPRKHLSDEELLAMFENETEEAAKSIGG